MYPHKLTIPASIIICFFFQFSINAQQRVPRGARVAIVVDERLSALRSTPELSGKLIRRIGRGRFVALRGSRKNRDGIVFYRVSVSTRTHGWIQREAVVSATQPGEDKRLATLIRESSDFDRIARTRIFLDLFPQSPLRLQMLILFADAAEEAATRLTREAARRLGPAEFSYYLNYTGLDRYNRQGVRFLLDRNTKQFRYDGAAWRELIRRHGGTAEAGIARERLAQLATRTSTQ